MSLPILRETSRCTGHCCDPVLYPIAPDTLRQLAGLASFGELADLWTPMGQDVTRNGYTRHLYKCKALVDGNCSIYDHRPDTCRNYPHPGNECVIGGCTRHSSRSDNGPL